MNLKSVRSLINFFKGAQMIAYSPTAVFENSSKKPMIAAGTAVYKVVVMLSLGKTACTCPIF